MNPIKKAFAILYWQSVKYVPLPYLKKKKELVENDFALFKARAEKIFAGRYMKGKKVKKLVIQRMDASDTLEAARQKRDRKKRRNLRWAGEKPQPKHLGTLIDFNFYENEHQAIAYHHEFRYPWVQYVFIPNETEEEANKRRMIELIHIGENLK